MKFKPLQEEDLDILHNWFQESTIKQSYARGQVFTFTDIKNKYLPRIIGQENVPSFIVNQDCDPVGFIQYYFVTENLPEGVKNYNNSLFNQYSPVDVVGLDCFLAEAKNRGKGLGEQMIINFVLEFLTNFNAIIVDPAKDNKSAIRCYEKAGFVASTYSEDNNYLIMIRQNN